MWIYRVAICGVGLLGLLVIGTTPATACSDLDFGDAPGFVGLTAFAGAPAWAYPTLLVDDGARHGVHSDLFLGDGVDFEPDGQPTPDATGDDLNGSDDDDGILFTSLLIAGHQATLDVDVFAVLRTAVLNAWIDFNADGDWNDAGEHIFDDTLVNPGPNSLSFYVPVDATLGETFARFRLNSEGGLAPTGLALDGEVEDYATSISSVPEPGTLSLVALGLIGLAGYGRR